MPTLERAELFSVPSDLSLPKKTFWIEGGMTHFVVQERRKPDSMLRILKLSRNHDTTSANVAGGEHTLLTSRTPANGILT